ncbi:MAG: thioesterase [bacterium]|nr:thioesterase [bacterium]
MIKADYSEKLILKYSELDQNLFLKPQALFNFLQDIASKNAEDLGFGYSHIHPNNYAWYLLKYRMEFYQYPTDIQELILVTEPRGYNKIFAYRDFEIYNKNSLTIKIASVWAIVNTKTFAMTPISEAIPNNPHMQQFKKQEDDLSFQKIEPLEQVDLTKNFDVRYNDLDVNGHVNNSNYIVWALEPLSFDFKNSKKIKFLDIVYKKEARYSDIVTSQIQLKEDNTTLHKLINENQEDLCNIKIVWENL